VNRLHRVSIIVLIVLGCVGLDQVTKEIARTRLRASEPISIWNDMIHLEYGENAGAFLGLGSTWPAGVRFLFGVLVVGIVVVVALGYALGAQDLTTGQWIGLALVGGGGIGNLIDRLTQQGVVSDFIRIGIWRLHTGVFNVADVALMVGVGLLMISGLKAGPQPAQAATPQDET